MIQISKPSLTKIIKLNNKEKISKSVYTLVGFLDLEYIPPSLLPSGDKNVALK